MTGKDFLDSKWCKKAASPQVQDQIKNDFSRWVGRVNNTGLLSRAKQLYQFFISGKVTGRQKLLVAGALLYIISPIDFIPDFIPVVGWLDDIGIASFALSYIFSQMDGLADMEASEELDRAKNMSTEEILIADIDGTKSNAFDFSMEDTGVECSDSQQYDTSNLQQRFLELSKIAETLHISQNEAVLAHIESRLSAKRMQKLAIVGRYSTGKSTLINSLLQKECLPTSPIPTTKAITFIVKGKENILCCEHVDGKVVTYDNINNINNIYDGDMGKSRKITLVLPDFPFANLAIVDTPGLEEPDSSIAQLTLDFLPEADAVVIVLDAGYIESKVEFDFIASLLKNDRNRKLFVVINKTDGMPESDVGRLKNVCLSNLTGMGVTSARIFPLSAIHGQQDAGFVKFRKELIDFITTDIREEALRHIKGEMDAYSKVLLDVCSTAVHNASLDKQLKMKNAEEAQNKIESISKEYEKQKSQIVRKFAAYQTQFFVDFSKFIDSLKVVARDKIMSASLQALRNTDNIALQLKQKIVEFLEKNLEMIESGLNRDIKECRKDISLFMSKLDMPVDFKLRDYSEYSSLFLPVVVAGSWFFCGFFSFLWTVIGAIVGRNFFESAISRFLQNAGINKARAKISDEVATNLEKSKRILENKLRIVFDAIEKDMLASFDASRDGSIAPLAVFATDATCSMETIDVCREKLVKMIKAKEI